MMLTDSKRIGALWARAAMAMAGLTLICTMHNEASAQGAVSEATRQPQPNAMPYQRPPAQDASGIVPVLLLQQSRYKAGEPIFVQLGFKNTSTHAVSIHASVAPWHQTVLTISGPSGPLVPNGKGEFGPLRFRPIDETIEPGATLLNKYYGQWYSLARWGYDITAPGKYVVVVRAIVGTYGSTNVDKEGTTTVSFFIDP